MQRPTKAMTAKAMYNLIWNLNIGTLATVWLKGGGRVGADHNFYDVKLLSANTGEIECTCTADSMACKFNFSDLHAITLK